MTDVRQIEHRRQSRDTYTAFGVQYLIVLPWLAGTRSNLALHRRMRGMDAARQDSSYSGARAERISLYHVHAAALNSIFSQVHLQHIIGVVQTRHLPVLYPRSLIAVVYKRRQVCIWANSASLQVTVARVQRVPPTTWACRVRNFIVSLVWKVCAM